MTSEEKTSDSFIRENLNIPEHIRIASIITIGYPAEEKKSVPANDLLRTRLHHNNYLPIGESLNRQSAIFNRQSPIKTPPPSPE